MRENFDKSVKMHEACVSDELRPALEHIYFKDGYAYASNAAVLVKNCIEDICFVCANQRQLLNGKLLHKDHYKEILKYNTITISEEGIECVDRKSSRKAFFYFAKEGEYKYPDAEKVLQNALNAKNTSVSEIGIKGNLIKIINNALFESDMCKFQFKGIGNPIVLQSTTSRSIGIIMPFILSENGDSN